MQRVNTAAAAATFSFAVLAGLTNPLDDIKNTRKISQVIMRGAAVDRSKPIP
jgi:hypothetical protein